MNKTTLMWYHFACHAQVMRLLLLLDNDETKEVKTLDLNNYKHRKVLNMLQVSHNGIIIASAHNIAWMAINEIFKCEYK